MKMLNYDLIQNRAFESCEPVTEWLVQILVDSTDSQSEFVSIMENTNASADLFSASRVFYSRHG
jgi:hypothetical protein